MYMASGLSLLISCVFHPLLCIYLLWFFAPTLFSSSVCLFLSSPFYFCLSPSIFCVFFSFVCISLQSPIILSLHICNFSCFLPLFCFILSFCQPLDLNHPLSLLTISPSSVTSKAVVGNWTKTGSITERDGGYQGESFSGQTETLTN